MSPFDLPGKTALVTGGGRGIGRDISLALASAGADVAIFYRSRADDANATADEIRGLGRKACTVQQDVGDLDTIAQGFEQSVAEMGRIDILVNNAGIADLIAFDMVDRDTMERTLQVNVTGPFFLTQAAAKHMIARGEGGRVINISSTNAFVGEALLAPYNASKGAMHMLTQSLAIELGPHQITVNSVAPGLIETEIGDDFPLKDGFWEHATEHIPLGHLGQPRHVAGAVVYLASDAASYMTGQHIIIDGGLIADQFPRMQFYDRPTR